jgi:hypothetical protein
VVRKLRSNFTVGKLVVEPCMAKVLMAMVVDVPLAGGFERHSAISA